MKKYILLILIALVLGTGVYFIYFKSQKSVKFSSNSKIDLKPTITLKESPDLGLFIQNQLLYDQIDTDGNGKETKIKILSNYKYYKFGQVPSGKYQGYDIYAVESIHGTYMSGSNSFSSTHKNNIETYMVYLIAVKDGKFVIYDKDEANYTDKVSKKSYLGPDTFPFGIDIAETIYINGILTLTKRNYDPDLLTNKILSDTHIQSERLDSKDNHEIYYIKNKDDNEEAYFVNYNGLAVFYEPTIAGVKNDFESKYVSKDKIGAKNLKYYNYVYYHTPCSSAISEDISKFGADITKPENLEVAFNNQDITLYRIKDWNNKTNSEFLKKLQAQMYYTNYEKLKISYDTDVNAKDLTGDGFLLYQDMKGIYRGLIQADSITVRGGCGKPVVYLYPEKDTKVSISFVNPVNFSTVIPNYENSWEVLAHSNGILNDLKPQLTDCNSFGNKHGSEYAKNACEKNEYPYLYWSGNAYGRNYPQAKNGFIVKKENLNNFFDEKLAVIGFNHKEINDFKEYWVSYLSNKNSEYLRITFFQNEIVNSMFPMKVNPTPNSAIRMFMDWDLANQNSQVEEQKLISYPRTGFTLVEWGGLKK